MKKLLAYMMLASSLAFIAGCELEESDDLNLTFENMSSREVQVIPLTSEWAAFTLQPGEKKKLYDIRDIDYRLRPGSRVQEGTASTERYIIIVDAPPKTT